MRKAKIAATTARPPQINAVLKVPKVEFRTKCSMTKWRTTGARNLMNTSGTTGRRVVKSASHGYCFRTNYACYSSDFPTTERRQNKIPMIDIRSCLYEM